ncbi:MAG: hypothetical protein ACLGIR_11450 [Actinomycetes bacterium]
MVDGEGGRGPEGLGGPGDRVDDLDVAVARLEDVLLSLPYDRALPDLASLLHAAGVGPELLRRDERALKVLHEAIVARPYADADLVSRRRTEVELLTMEVGVLTERLRDPAAGADEIGAAAARLSAIRRRLEELRDGL